VLCGLYSTNSAREGSLYNITVDDGAVNPLPIRGADLLVRDGSYERDWARPLIIDQTIAVEAIAVHPARVDAGALALSGFHVTPATAKALRTRGEFWAMSMLVETSAAKPQSVVEHIFTTDILATHLLSSDAAGANPATVDSLTMKLANLDITPQPLRRMNVFARSTAEPTSTLGVPCRRTSRWQIRMDMADTRSAYWTLLGAAVRS
jgi:hypothetical protein